MFQKRVKDRQSPSHLSVLCEALRTQRTLDTFASPKDDAPSLVRRTRLGRPVAQIADWLEKLGLEQYAKLFSDNDIDISVPHLSDQDLKDLGISLGHRRKIFAAINKGVASVQPLAEAERPEEPTIQDAPERLTLLSYSLTW